MYILYNQVLLLSNARVFDLVTNTSDSPLLFSDAITSPLSLRFAYPGNGVNTGSNPGLLLVAKNALISEDSLT